MAINAIDLQDSLVFHEIKNGEVDLSVAIIDEDIIENNIYNYAYDFLFGENNFPEITLHFSIKSIIDGMVFGNSLPVDDEQVIDIDAKSVFDLIKLEMLKQIDRIDALKFGTLAPS